MGDNYGNQQLLEHVLGSSGLGHTPGLADFTGLTSPFLADEAGRQAADGHPIAGAANLLMAMPIPGAAMVKGAGRVANKLVHGAEATAPIIAYHGSPHTFDAFDTSKIGTGEGAQAYGHGLYFAENEGVAKQYRDALSLPSTPGNDVAKYWLSQAGGDKPRAVAMLENHAQQSGIPLAQIADAKAAISNGGSVYQVGIKADPAHFLDWDAPLSEQHPVVKQAAKSVLGDNLNEGYFDTGAALHRQMEKVLRAGAPFDGDGSAVARALADNGVLGIKYLDADSRGAATAGTRNYVVFSPENIDILKRYGVAGLGIGAGGAAVVGQTPDTSEARP